MSLNPYLAALLWLIIGFCSVYRVSRLCNPDLPRDRWLPLPYVLLAGLYSITGLLGAVVCFVTQLIAWSLSGVKDSHP